MSHRPTDSIPPIVGPCRRSGGEADTGAGPHARPRDRTCDRTCDRTFDEPRVSVRRRLAWRTLLGRIAAVAVLIGLGLGVATTPLTARAQASAGGWPDRPVRLVVPFPPGGSTDLLARRFGEKLTATWGQPVVVENRPGAGGTVGADHVAKAAPDGYTLLMGVTGTNAISGALYPKLPYDPVKDLAPVSLVVSAPLVLVRGPRFPAVTLPEVVARARAKPGSVTFGSPGNGTSMHLTGEMFKQAAGVSMLHIPYKGSAGALQDLLAGEIDTMWGDLLVVLPQIQSGKLHAIAVTSRGRDPLLPDVPTVAGSGYPGFEALSWQGLFAPARTDPAVVARINRDVNAAMAGQELKAFFASRGFTIGGSTPDGFRVFVEEEVAKWARIVRTAGVRIE